MGIGAGGFAGGFAGSFVGAMLNGATVGQAFRAGLIGGLTGAAFGYAGATWDAGSAQNYLAHAAIGCGSAVASGGNSESCARGAASAVIGKAVTVNASGDNWNSFTRGVAATVSGGVTSRIMGGTFANGARTAAYGYLFNELMHRSSAYQQGYESRAEVLTFEPTGWGGSSFGHSAILIDGLAYSFGPSGMSIESAGTYLQKNSFRSGVGLEIILTTTQATNLQQFLSSFSSTYSVINFSTCVQPVVYALAMAGVTVGTPVFPVSLGGAVLNSGRVSSSNFYQQTTTPTKPWWYPTERAPWAR